MRNYNIEQNGRSMIEMLGVLAIVGVLSVAGIAGYSKAMNKYKSSKLQDQISMTAANVRTMFASEGNYSGLTKTDIAYNLGLFGDDLTKTCNGTFTDGCVVNAMGGVMGVQVAGAATTPDLTNYLDAFHFSVVVGGLDKEACSNLALSDWGQSDGVTISAAKSITTSKKAIGTVTSANLAIKSTTAANKRMTAVATACSACKPATPCTVGILFK